MKDDVNAELANTKWSDFLSGLEKLDCPLLLEFFEKGHVLFLSKERNLLMVDFDDSLAHYDEAIKKASHLWRPLLYTAFWKDITLMQFFGGKLESEIVLDISKAAIKEISSDQKK